MSKETTTFFEQILFHFILSDDTLYKNTVPECFNNKYLKELFIVCVEHTEKYKTPPTIEQVLKLIDIKGLSDVLTKDIVETIYQSANGINEYEHDWLLESAKTWIQYRNIELSMKKAISYIKVTPPSAENIGAITEDVKNIITKGTSITFDEKEGINFFDPSQHAQKRLAKTSTGYNFIDLCQKGGNWKGSLIVYMAGPKSGKSFWLCNLAAEAVKQGKNVAYITLELQEELVAMRIGSNLLSVPLEVYEKFSERPDLVNQAMEIFKRSCLKDPGYLHIKEYPSSSAGVPDIERHLIKTEERLGIKFDEIYIDYINIMKNYRNPNSENTYLKLKQIAEDSRAMGQRNNWTVVSVTQVNRGSIESNDLSMTALSESMGVAHTVDMLYGLITSPEYKAGGYFFVKCILDRVAPYDNTKKKFLMDWKYGRSSEDMASEIESMDIYPTYIDNPTTNKHDNGFKKKLEPVVFMKRKEIDNLIENNPNVEKTTTVDLWSIEN